MGGTPLYVIILSACNVITVVFNKQGVMPSNDFSKNTNYYNDSFFWLDCAILFNLLLCHWISPI